MPGVFANAIRKLANVFAVRPMFYSPALPDRIAPETGWHTFGPFRLGPGRWLILAKASATGLGANAGSADCRLKLDCVEGEALESDESYAWAAPLQSQSMAVQLPVTVAVRAEVTLQVASQFQLAEFRHLRLTAIRDLNSAT